MAFSDFKEIPEVQAKFGIRHRRQDFIQGEPSNPSEQFLQELAFTRQHIDVLASEAAKCQALIYPILREVYKPYAEGYALWIEKSMTYNDTLSGTPDYFVSTRSELGPLVVGSPLIMLVEAKRNDFETGWGQCLAELVAAQKINADAGFPVYGIVTDGERWQFGRLVGDTFTEDTTFFSLQDLPALFGAIDAIFKAASTTHAGGREPSRAGQ